MTKQQAIKKFGTVAQLARVLGVSVQAVRKWKDTIPAHRVAQIKALRK